jgi:hypothetical protein
MGCGEAGNVSGPGLSSPGSCANQATLPRGRVNIAKLMASCCDARAVLPMAYLFLWLPQRTAIPCPSERQGRTVNPLAMDPSQEQSLFGSFCSSEQSHW